MSERLSLQNIIGMGFMLFAMFLGAGNLIFPPLAGLLSGTSAWSSAAGFLMTGVGLPLLGLIVIARVGGGFNDITKELPSWLIILMGSFIYLIIGPLYAVPRTGMVAYEVGIIPFLEEPGGLSRFLFSLIFFSVSWLLCLTPGKLLENIGKIITPALILLLLVLSVTPIIMPISAPGSATGDYAESPFIHGFLEGYMTMDALASLMFGGVIITNLRSHGITSQRALSKYSIITALIAMSGLALVYLSLFNLGATSLGVVDSPDNGAQILAEYVEATFGTPGSVLLAAIVMLACLTTAVGCVTAASGYFCKFSDKLSYRSMVAIISIACMTLANLGLNQIIVLFIPVLLVIYPVCITLICLGLMRDFFPNPKLVYRYTLGITFFMSLIDAGENISHPVVQGFIACFEHIPGYQFNLTWLLPSIISIVVTMVIGKLTAPEAIGKNQTL